MFEGKVLLITGGTGSFGMAVTKHFLQTNIKEIRIFSRDEKKQEDMRKQFKSEKLKFFLGDVRESLSMKMPFYGVDYIFHAAALKQVPSCEFFPMEAVKTNVIGADNVLNMAIDSGVKKVVMLSTDKAVYPVNAMGISKAMMEKIFIAKALRVDPEETLICGTRYGNVMASRGSVIPLFVSQITKGEPLTITDPNMTRFLMDINEAVELVMYAFENAKAGDIMIQKAPSCRVGDLAQALLEIFEADNPIKIIGTRHGEKQYESLLSREEKLVAIDKGDFYRIPADNRDLNYDKYDIEGNLILSSEEEYNSNNTKVLTVEEIKKKLLNLAYIQEKLEKWKKR